MHRSFRYESAVLFLPALLAGACVDAPRVVSPLVEATSPQFVEVADTDLGVPAPYVHSKNLHLTGFSARTVPFLPAGPRLNSDLAFWGRLAFQGTFDGFRIIDISQPDNPVEIVNYEDCSAAQGDLVVWEHLLIRTWDAPAPAGRTCGGNPVFTGFQGISIFDISNPASPQHIRDVSLSHFDAPRGCGAHTATAVPDPARGQLYVYVGGSSSDCPGIDIVSIDIADPTEAWYLWRQDAFRQCHDVSVFLGEPSLAVCSGGDGFSVFQFDRTIDPFLPGGIVDPNLLYTRPVTGVTIGHSASFSWDGRVIVFGHEPGGGLAARCQESSSLTDRSIFFFDALSGAQLGTFVHQRPQTALENCTWHNFNVVPLQGRNIFVSGNYQGGISVVDFTNPANAREIAFADPAPIINPASPSSITLGGDWAAYWYNGRIYESDMRRGLLVWNMSGSDVAGATRLPHLNPQTQDPVLLRGRR